jgi:hypothetical protein
MHASTRLRRLLALALLVSAGLFVVGVIVERSERGSESHATTHEEPGTEHGEEGEEGHTDGPAPKPEVSSERLLGIDPESTALVVVAALASIALAVAVVRTRSAAVLWIALAFGLAFAVLDVRELVHQADESRTGLVVLAGAVAVLHLAVAALAAAGLARRRPAVA